MDMDVVDLASQLVAIDSQNPRTGEGSIAVFIEHEVAVPAGLTVNRCEFVEGRPNLLVSVDGGPGPHLTLSGHLDTKPIADALAQWHTDPLKLTIVNGVAYGLGASDMKGAVASMLVALHRFAARGSGGRVTVLLTADEEQGSGAGAKALADQGLPELDGIIIGEPCGIDTPWELLALVSRGIYCFEVAIHAKQGHSGLSGRLGRNAVLIAADVARALETLVPPVARPGLVPAAPTMNAGMLIHGGVCFGTWPGECLLGCEIRLVPGMDQQQVRAAIYDTVARAVGLTASFDIRYVDGPMGWMPAVELDPSSTVAKAAQAACVDVLGRELPVRASPGGTDATYLMGTAGIPTVASLGPGWLSVAHGPNECVLVQDLYQAADLYERLIGHFQQLS